MDSKKSFLKIYFGIAYADSGTSGRRDTMKGGRIFPLYFYFPPEKEELLGQDFLQMLDDEEVPERIKDLADYGRDIKGMTERVGMTSEVAQRIRTKLQACAKESKESTDKEHWKELVERGDIYSLMADPLVWQRQRVLGAINLLLRGVIEEGKYPWTIGEEEEIEFNATNLDFKRIEKICFELIEAGWIKQGLYILEAMREKITNPLIRGIVLYYYDSEEAKKIFLQHEEEIKRQIAQWF